MNKLENIQNQKIIHFPAQQNASTKTKRPRPPVARQNTADTIPSKNTDDLECLDIQSVADLMAVSADTIRRLIKRGKLKAVKIGKSVRVFRWSIDEYLRTNAVTTENQTEEKQPRRRTSNGAGYRAALKKAQELGINL